MRIVVLSNPISGAGRAAAHANLIAQALVEQRHEVTLAATCKTPPDQWLVPLLAEAELLVIVGGDGAVRMASGAVARASTPIYHFPMGTENLFAREFGMDRSPGTLIAAIERREIRAVDLGFANGEPFTLMASVGFDANVVHELATCRGASISHFSYVPPIWRQLRRWKPAIVNVAVDGELVSDGEPGFVVVANSRQYGWRIDPAARASMSDGLLDVAWFPTRSRLDLVKWATKCRLRRQFNDARLVYRTGRHVTINCDSACQYQLDGDPPAPPQDAAIEGPPLAAQSLQLEVRVEPGVLRVLTP